MLKNIICRSLLAATISSLFVSTSYADDIEVFFNGTVNAPAKSANIETKIIELLDSATTSIDIAVYDADLPKIADALVRAKLRNVDIRLVTDNDNTGSSNSDFYGALNSAGIPWVDDTADGSSGSGLQHNKWIVVDDRHVLMGSTNFTQSGTLGDLNTQGNLISKGNDNHILLIDSIQLANQIDIQMDYMWGDGPNGKTDSLFGLPKPDHKLTTVYTTNDNIRMEVLFTPQSKSNIQDSGIDITSKYLASANGNSEIDFAQFVISSQDIADSAEIANNAGAIVRGIGDTSFFFRYYSEFQDMLGNVVVDESTGRTETEDNFTGALNNPWANPAEMYPAFHLDGGDKWHHKYIRVDNSVLTGSHNSSGAASFTNDETILIIYDAETAAEFKGHFDINFCLSKREFKRTQEDCTPTFSGGTWEGINFSGEEVRIVLDIVNNATLEELDSNANMSSTAAQNIVTERKDARIYNMDELTAIPYIGSAAMEDLKLYVPTWSDSSKLENTPIYQGGTWDGVTFNTDEVAIVLDIVNNATLTNLDDDAAMNALAAKNIVAAQPNIADMDELAAISYVGTSAMEDLKAYIPIWLSSKM